MRHDLKKPCNECPFRRKSIPGWMGDATPEEFIEATMADAAMPCHMTVDYEDPNWPSMNQPETSYCYGALVFFRNTCKKSRDKERPIAEPSKDVFAHRMEFLNHHLRKDQT